MTKNHTGMVRAAGAALLVLGMGVAVVPATVPAMAASLSRTAPLTLKSITFQGNKQVPTSDLAAAMPYHAGDTVTLDQMGAAQQAILGVYKKANVGLALRTGYQSTGKALRVVFGITEQAGGGTTPQALVLDKVVFEGNKKVSTEELEAATTLKPGAKVDDASVTADEKAVQQVYVKRKVGVGITVEPTYPNKDNHVVLTYHLDESGKAKAADAD